MLPPLLAARSICRIDCFDLFSHRLQIVGDLIVSPTDHVHLFTERILMHPLSFFAPASYSDAAAPHTPLFQEFMNACLDTMEGGVRAATALRSFNFGEKLSQNALGCLCRRQDNNTISFFMPKNCISNRIALTCSNLICSHQVSCGSNYCYQEDGGR